ncbi:MAG: polysaccharide biosynthesis tyrosine autokinase [Weeksellaceae bacterium]
MSDTNNTIKSVSEKTKRNNPFFFDIERFLYRITSNWLLYLIAIIFAIFIVTYINNWHLDRVYRAESTFNISSRSTGNTNMGSNSINFIWGGNSGKSDILTQVLQSRTHSYNVAKKIEAYVSYWEEGTLKKSNSHRDLSPFLVKIDTLHNQTIGIELQIKKRDDKTFEIIPLTNLLSNQVYNYAQDTVYDRNVKVELPKTAKFGEWIEHPDYRFKIIPTKRFFSPSDKYSFVLTNLDVATNRVRNGISVDPVDKGSSVLILSKTAYTQQEAIDVINNSLNLLSKNELEEKNLAARRTLDYIGEQIGIVKAKVDSSSQEYQKLQKDTKIYDFTGEKGEILASVKELEKQRVSYQEKIKLLNSVSNNVYQSGTQGMMDLQVFGLDESNFISELGILRGLELQKENLRMLYKEGSREIIEIDSKIAESKSNIQRLIGSSRDRLNKELGSINQELRKYDSKAFKLPEQEKQFLDVARGFSVNDELYNQLLSQYSQAELQIASNISDITVIDYAKYLGQSPISPDKRTNLIAAIALAFIFPTLILFAREILDTKIKGIQDIVKVTHIPLIGVIGNSFEDNPVVVLDKPKSSISEAFRAVRSNLQFLYKTNNKTQNRTILVTSSIGGEGKTFISMNIATALAISGKKTILIGMDMRKPKIFDEFELNNKIGLSNYLSGNAELNDAIQKTKVDTLHIITGGPIPPNPSELLLSDTLKEMIDTFKSDYDFIVLDTPPVGLVADAFDLMKYADASLYVARYDYTYRGLLHGISEKYDEGEVKNIGIVLNDYQFKGGYGYGYGYSYGYGYGYGYFEEDANFDPSLVGKIKRFLNFKKFLKRK